MPILLLEDAHLAWGHYPLLDGAEFALEPRERIGIIGRNGAGKSSLLSVLAGNTPLDQGQVRRDAKITLSFLQQEPELDPKLTVLAAVSAGLGAVRPLIAQYHQISLQLAQANADTEALLEQLHHIQHELELQGGWDAQHRIDAVIDRLQLPADKLISELSGGWKKRTAIAQAMVTAPDVLLLDEPTNHLDIEAIQWLEALLLDFKGSIIFITHDRRFLDNIATRIVELDRGHLRSYPGSFSDYQTKKQQELEVEEEQAAKFDKLVSQEEEWARQGVKARRKRNQGRVQRLEDLRQTREQRRTTMGKATITLEEATRSGELVAELDKVSKSFHDKTVIRDFSTRIMRKDRIGIIGPNGSGKSTLLKLITGELQPDSGQIKLGTRLQVAYFDQMRDQLKLDDNLIDAVSPSSDYIEIGGKRKHVIGYLGEFLFPPERTRSPVKTLSGGERARLLLAKLFTQPANCLVLDEPTNDLDLETLDLLESLIDEFGGTVFLVSHDRDFLDNCVSQIIAFEGDGKWLEYAGGYSDVERTRKAEAKDKSDKEGKPQPVKTRQNREKRVKLSYKETKELETLPAEIEKMEERQAWLAEELGKPEIYTGQGETAAQYQQETSELGSALERAYARWEELEAKEKESLSS